MHDWKKRFPLLADEFENADAFTIRAYLIGGQTIEGAAFYPENGNMVIDGEDARTSIVIEHISAVAILKI